VCSALTVVFFYLALSTRLVRAATYVSGMLDINGKVQAQRSPTFADYLTSVAGGTMADTGCDSNGKFVAEVVNFNGTFDRVSDGSIDFLYTNPSAFSCAESEFGMAPLVTLLNLRQGQALSEFGSIAFVSSDSRSKDIETWEDFRGKVVSGVSITGLGAYQMQERVARQRDADLLTVTAQTVFTYQQQHTVMDVVAGIADVGLVRTDMAESMHGKPPPATWDAPAGWVEANPDYLFNMDDIRVIEPLNPATVTSRPRGAQVGTPSPNQLDGFPFPTSTRLYPEWSFATRSSVPTCVQEAVQAALLALDGSYTLNSTSEADALVALRRNPGCEGLTTTEPGATGLPGDPPAPPEGASAAPNDGFSCYWAIRALTDGKYVTWIPAVSYMSLRDLQEELEIIKLPEGVCKRNTEVYESITCPDGFFRRSRENVDTGCADAGLLSNCLGDRTCLCEPCRELPGEEFQLRLDGGPAVGGGDLTAPAVPITCEKMQSCGEVRVSKTVGEQKTRITVVDVWAEAREGLEQSLVPRKASLVVTLNGKTDVFDRDGLNDEGDFDFDVRLESVGTAIIQAFIEKDDGEGPVEIIRSPTLVRVIEDGGLSKGAVAGIALGGIFAVLIIILLVLIVIKIREAGMWRIRLSELEFPDPPVILGRGTFGLVEQALFRGTRVAIKRIAPPQKSDLSPQLLREVSAVNTMRETLQKRGISGMAGLGTQGFGRGVGDSLAPSGPTRAADMQLVAPAGAGLAYRQNKKEAHRDPRKKLITSSNLGPSTQGTPRVSQAGRTSSHNDQREDTSEGPQTSPPTEEQSASTRRRTDGGTAIKWAATNDEDISDDIRLQEIDIHYDAAQVIERPISSSVGQLPSQDVHPGKGSLSLRRPSAFNSMFQLKSRGGNDAMFGSGKGDDGENDSNLNAASANRARKQAIRNFLKEIALVSQLRHPSLLTVMGAVTERGKDPILVTELMERGSLGDAIENPTIVFEAGTIKQLLIDIASGVLYLHSSGISHNDLKAQNVLIDTHMRAKVADFGLSSKRTATSLVGTPYWMAPELLRGEPGDTKAADVYAFGVTMSEILTRRDPYHDLVPIEVLEGVADPERVPPLRPALPDGLPRDLYELINECWHKNPARRPNFSEVLARLEDINIAELGEHIDKMHVGKVLYRPKENSLNSPPTFGEDGASGRGDNASGRMSHTPSVRVVAPSGDSGNVNIFSSIGESTGLRRRIEESLAGRGPANYSEPIAHVTVVFIDIVGFTAITAQLGEPSLIGDLLQRYMGALDCVVDDLGMLVVDVVGDAYLTVAGCSGDLGADDPVKQIEAAARFAIRAVDIASNTPIHAGKPKLGNIKVRAGVATGPVTAAVLGHRSRKFSLFGDAVNLASRMESTGYPSLVQMSAEAAKVILDDAARAQRPIVPAARADRDKLAHECMALLQAGKPTSSCVSCLASLLKGRGLVEVHGKGLLRTWWLQVPGGLRPEQASVGYKAKAPVNVLAGPSALGSKDSSVTKGRKSDGGVLTALQEGDGE